MSSTAPTFGRLMTYRDTRGPYDGNSTRRFLANVAAGNFWYVAADFKDGRQFDPQPVQAKKAQAVLQELDAAIAEFPNSDSLPDDGCGTGSRVDTQAQIMVLTLRAEMKFDEAVTRIVEEVQQAEVPDAPEPSDDTSHEVADLSGEEKLTQAKEFARSFRLTPFSASAFTN
jgi:hypothetical protein